MIKYAESTENAVWTNQFDNIANRQAHYETTGPEIWQQTNVSNARRFWGGGLSCKEKNVKVLYANFILIETY